MPQSTLTSKNQTTIPKAVIEALNLRPSDQLVYEIEEDGRIILSAKTGTFASVAASLPRKAAKGRVRSGFCSDPEAGRGRRELVW